MAVALASRRRISAILSDLGGNRHNLLPFKPRGERPVKSGADGAQWRASSFSSAHRYGPARPGLLLVSVIIGAQRQRAGVKRHRIDAHAVVEASGQNLVNQA